MIKGLISMVLLVLGMVCLVGSFFINELLEKIYYATSGYNLIIISYLVRIINMKLKFEITKEGEKENVKITPK